MPKAAKEKREAVVQKVKGLLAIANDKHDDDECQSAFLLAQRMMIKYAIDQSEVSESLEEIEPIGETPVTIYKRVQWWEKILACIIASNFKVKVFVSTRYSYNEKYHKVGKTAIKFYGQESDLELAKEMFILAYEATQFFAKRFVDNTYQRIQEEGEFQRDRSITSKIKNSYIRGFLAGLSQKFESQVQEHGLMVLVSVPEVVEQEWNLKFSGRPQDESKLPPVEIQGAYSLGYMDGNDTDFDRNRLYE